MCTMCARARDVWADAAARREPNSSPLVWSRSPPPPGTPRLARHETNLPRARRDPRGARALRLRRRRRRGWRRRCDAPNPPRRRSRKERSLPRRRFPMRRRHHRDPQVQGERRVLRLQGRHGRTWCVSRLRQRDDRDPSRPRAPPRPARLAISRSGHITPTPRVPSPSHPPSASTSPPLRYLRVHQRSFLLPQPRPSVRTRPLVASQRRRLRLLRRKRRTRRRDDVR